MANQRNSGTYLLIGGIVLAAPIAFVFERLLSAFLFPADFEIARQWLGPALSVLSWILVIVTALLGGVGLALQHALNQKRLTKFASAPPAQRLTALNQVFLITTSIPQLPAIAITFLHMFGASLTPTLVGLMVCSLSLVAQGAVLVLRSRAQP